jgi:transglutaminase-like putative cysteine protease
VPLSHHLLNLRPRNLPSQFCEFHELDISPEPSSFQPHRDYFGNHCAFVTVEGAHTELRITARSRVARSMPFVPDFWETPVWENARAQVLTDRSGPGLEALEFSFDSPLIPKNAELAGYAAKSFQPRRPLMEAAVDLNRRIFEEFEFDPAATDVSTPVSEVFQKRRGVCQDFAHLLIACLRSLGVPARYVSGYLETDPPPGSPKLVGSDASHAWVSFWCPGIGWIDLDPTNNCVPSMRHVIVGWGRDYGDVSPVRGIIHGSGSHDLIVGVDLTAIGPETSPSPTAAEA